MLNTKNYLRSISKKYKIYEMLKYHTLGLNSPLNYRGLIFGKESISLFKWFKNYNYSTIALPGYYDVDLRFYGKSSREYVDYNIQLFHNCSESYLYGSRKRCLGNKHRHKHQLEFLESIYLFNRENNIPTFSYTSFMESHDKSFISLLRMDNDIANHFKLLEKNKIMENSITLLIGDHGMHYGKYFNSTV